MIHYEAVPSTGHVWHYTYQLIHSLISHQRFSHKQHQVRGVDRDQLRQSRHQRSVILHTAGGIDQHHVKALVTSCREREALTNQSF